MIIVNNKNYIPQEFSNGERKFFIEKGNVTQSHWL